MAGEWTAAARSDLRSLSVWLADQEARWVQSHADYKRSDKTSEQNLEASLEQEQRAILQLTWQTGARATLEFVACCHPRPENRALAQVVSASVDLFSR